MSLLVYFAPLQGYTDVVYRKAHAALFGGIAAYYTPFVRIEKGDFRRKDLRDIDFENNRGVPVVPQAIASESDELRRIVDCMASLGYTRVDINLGCPFPILAYRHKGSGILPFPDEVERLLRPLESYDSLEFSVKMRLGWEEPSEALRLCLKVCLCGKSRFMPDWGNSSTRVVWIWNLSVGFTMLVLFRWFITGT